MRRILFLTGLAGMALAAAVIVYHPSNAEPNKPQAPDDVPSSRAVQLPVGQVVLFSSGVGYFQREGSVEGDARVDLSFPATDINDLIKSMVLRDLKRRPYQRRLL